MSSRRVIKDLPEEPAARALKALGGRWKITILFHVFDEPRRFSELERLVEGITQKVLAEQLRELEEHGLVSRTVHPDTPPRVDYVANGARPQRSAAHARALRVGREACCRSQAVSAVGRWCLT